MASPNSTHITWINVIATVAVIFTAAGGMWVLVQQQFSSLEHQFTRATDQNSSAIGDVKRDLDTLTREVVNRHEHEEFVKRLDGEIKIVKEQLRVLEATRPTTGELQQVGTATDRQILEIKERVRSLEDYMRRPQNNQTPSQSAPH